MKNTKRARRAAAFAAAVVMAACAAIPMGSSFSASAVTITVKETEANHTFKAYQIFNGTVDDKGTVSGITWGEGFTDVNNTIYTDLADTKIQVDGKKIFDNVSSPAEVADALSKLTSGEKDAYGDMDKVASVFQEHIDTTKAVTFTQNTSAYESEDAKDGYYLIVDEVPTEGSVTSVSKYLMNVFSGNVTNNTINTKRDQPQVMKKIKENTKADELNPEFKNKATGDTGYNDTADYCIGDSVPFKLYGSLPSTLDNYQNGYKYVFHDSLDTEFNAPTAVTVKVGKYYVKATEDKTGYQFVKNAQHDTGNHTFDIVFEDIKSVKLYDDAGYTQEAADVKVSKDDVVTVSYDAVLNANAKIGRPGQKNDVYLEYANDSNWNGKGTPTTSETPHDNVIAFTYELDLTKVDGADESKTLAGASFVLERTVGSQKQYAVLDEDNKITDWLTATDTVTVDTTKGTIATSDNAWISVYGKTPATPTISTTGADGTFSYIGLDDGTYVVREVKAPTGYKIADGGQEFTFVVSADTTNGQNGEGVDAEGTALKSLKLYKDSIDAANNNLLDTALDNDSDMVGKVDTTITNTSSSTLPSTGGIGTTMFYVGGGVLVAGAGVILITKKRAKKDAE